MVKLSHQKILKNIELIKFDIKNLGKIVLGLITLGIVLWIVGTPKWLVQIVLAITLFFSVKIVLNYLALVRLKNMTGNFGSDGVGPDQGK